MMSPQNSQTYATSAFPQIMIVLIENEVHVHDILRRIRFTFYISQGFILHKHLRHKMYALGPYENTPTEVRTYTT